MLPLLVLIVACILGLGGTMHHLPNARQLYTEFKRTYGKSYDNEDDDEYRFTIFKDNLLLAKRMQDVEQGTAEYGVTQFSDLTRNEFQMKYMGMRLIADSMRNIKRQTMRSAIKEVPEAFDWREHGAVGPIVSQGHCGSCWAFSVIGNIEGQWFRKTGKLLKLSEQQLLDCDRVDHGCDGGYPPLTYDEIQRMGGLELSADYPYSAVAAAKCHVTKSLYKAYINGSIALPADEQLQTEHVWMFGPMASALNANTLQFYRKGIVHPRKWLCSHEGLNHAVLTVGYGSENGIPYWIVKNSWGMEFGEQGYFRIHRGDGTCGIDSLMSTAVIH